jgi:hypothetical protein
MLDDLGNIGDFVGGVAVIASFIYLALQIRQNTKTLRANSVQELTENILRASATLAEPANADIYTRGARSYSALAPDEKLRFQLLLGLFFGRFDTVLEYRERKMVDDTYIEWQLDAIKVILANPGVREFWQSQRRVNTTQRVRDWVDKYLAA